MRNLLKHLQNTNAREHLWVRNETILLGVSGGADSMCLLHLFAQLMRKEGLRVIVTHVNYGLRGEASERDARHVQRWAQRLAMPYEMLKVPRQKQRTSENVWRKQRYAFFADIAKKHHATKIAVAHNQNDQAETLLLNLLRGSGLEGLRGMPFRKDTIIRPLLNVPRHHIVAYCKKYHIRYYNDATNTDTTFTRNRIRHTLLPHLAREYNPDVVASLAKTASLLAEDYTMLEKSVHLWTLNSQHTVATCALQDFTNLSVSTQRNTLRDLFQKMMRATYKPSSGIVEECRRAVLSTKNKTQIVHVGNLSLTQKGGIVRFTCKHTSN